MGLSIAIFRKLHTYLETAISELTHGMLIAEKRKVSGEWRKREAGREFPLFFFIFVCAKGEKARQPASKT